MEKNNQVRAIMVGAITLILGLALLASLPSMVSPLAYKSSVTDETYNLSDGCHAGGEVNESDAECNWTVANAPYGWRTDSCALESVTVTNSSGSELTESTDYNLYDSQGIIQFLNTTDTNSTYLVVAEADYSYCGDEMIEQSWVRNILVLLIGIFAITLVGVSIAVLVKSFGDVIN